MILRQRDIKRGISYRSATGLWPIDDDGELGSGSVDKPQPGTVAVVFSGPLEYLHHGARARSGARWA